MRYSNFRLLLLTFTALSLAACASTQGTQATSTKGAYDDKINAALERAANQASRDGSSASSLALMERLYKRDPKNADNALKFARALRQNGDQQKAAVVLAPFADKGDATTDTLIEMATLHLNATKYGMAENTARKAIAKDADAYRAYQILGIALEGQSKYKEAETAFRQALDLWQGDPIPVMNNLALNLTNQERLPEALEIMERAKEAAPNRREVERNLRIIRTLNETASGRPAPKPSEKPGVKPIAARAADVEPSAPYTPAIDGPSNKKENLKDIFSKPTATKTSAPTTYQKVDKEPLKAKE